MMALDFRGYGKKLTLEKCSQLYDEFIQILTPLPVKIGVKGRIIIVPDLVWITQWQQDNIFVGGVGRWDRWRDIPIVVFREPKNDTKST